jgi:hypothetical protein
VSTYPVRVDEGVIAVRVPVEAGEEGPAEQLVAARSFKIV